MPFYRIAQSRGTIVELPTDIGANLLGFGIVSGPCAAPSDPPAAVPADPNEIPDPVPGDPTPAAPPAAVLIVADPLAAGNPTSAAAEPPAAPAPAPNTTSTMP